MSEWKEYKLGDVAKIQTGPFGSQLHQSDYVAVGIPSIMPTNIGNRLNIVRNDLVFIGNDDAQRLSKYLVNEGDIVYSRRGDVEKCAYITDDEVGWLCGTGCLRIRINKSESNPRFIAYYLSTEESKGWISNNAVGSTMPNLNSSILQDVPLKLPSLFLQEQIAGILSSLDDKIDLLGRQNATLEAMAETLFRQYFIESPKTEWKDGAIADIAKHSKIAIHPQKQPAELFYHYSIPSFDNAKTPTLDLGVEIQSNKYKVSNNSILFSKLNPHKDKRVWLLLNSVRNNSVCSTEFQIIEPINKEYLYFVYGWLTHSENYNDIASGVGGTSGSHQRIDPATIFSFVCPIIDIDYIRLYNIQAKPLFEKQINNQEQIRSLTKLRDTLLPKLMNNEIKI